MFDLVIRNGHLVDPAGTVNEVCNLGISDGSIAAITPAAVTGRFEIDAEGLTVVPGCIDIHMHEDPLNADGSIHWHAHWFMAQMGVTTAVGGNCGHNAGGVPEYYRWIRRHGSPVNYAGYIGHTTLRSAAGCTDRYRASNTSEIETMKGLLRANLASGAVGLSFGLEYDPGASPEECLALAQVVAEFPGKICSIHQRYDSDRCLEAVVEAIGISRESGVPMQISHIGSMCGFGQMTESLALIDQARAEGLDITADCYPYAAFATNLGSAVFDDGCLAKWGVGYDSLVVGTGAYAGRRLDEELFFKLRRAEPETAVIAFVINEAEVRQALRHPAVSVGSDGHLVKGQGHPRGAGTFPRVLGRMVREGHLSFMDALKKCTVMNADRLGWTRKGRLQEGCDADLLVLDPTILADQNSFEHPAVLPAGLHAVLVGGQVAVRDNAPQAGRWGKAVLDFND